MNPPSAVLEVCRKLTAAGHKAWLAGGCVRDMVLKREPRDWDVVTDAPLATIQKLFPDGLEVGAAFGIVKLPKINTDVAIFRKEGEYSDFRHPDSIEPGDETSDSARRDFTVNAMYFDPVGKTIVDHVKGQRDLQSKTIRTVGDPKTRFSEDALRILRAVRFSAQLGFKIDRETAAALRACSPLLAKISRERVREEVIRLLESPRPVMGLEAVAQNGLWEQVFGVRRVSMPADFRHMKLPEPLTALHWICALAVTGLLGDPLKEPGAIVERITERLRLSNVEKRVLTRVLRVYTDAVAEKPEDTPQDWIELARQDRVLLERVKSFIRRARGPTEDEKQRALNHVDQVLRWAAKPGSEKTWPDAQTLQKEGFKAGKELGLELRQRHWQAFRTQRPS